MQPSELATCGCDEGALPCPEHIADMPLIQFLATTLYTSKHCKIQIGAYKRPDLRRAVGGLWSNKRRRGGEPPSDSVGLALLDAPPGRRPDGRLLLAADPDGRGTRPLPGSWDGETAAEGRMA